MEIFMKYKVVVILLISLVFISSCTYKNNSNSISTEKIQEEYSITEEEETVDDREIIDGWYLDGYIINDKNENVAFYVPYYVKKKGVEYYTIDSEENAKQEQELVADNKPSGTEFKKGAAQFYRNIHSQPIIENGKVVDIPKVDIVWQDKAEYLFSNIGYSNESTGFDYSTYMTIKRQYSVIKSDVVAFSVALYEETMPIGEGIEISIYGIPYEYAKQQLGENFIYTMEDEENFSENIHYNYTEFDKVCSGRIKDTGVYYIDLSDEDTDEMYWNYYVVLDFDDSIIKYYDVNGNYGYNITNQSEYEAWKEQNKDKFLN